MIQRTIEKLRERTEEERAAFAGSVAIGVVIVLFLGWAAFFFSRSSAVPESVPPAQEATTSEQTVLPFDQIAADHDAQVQMSTSSAQ
ncbi:hypothetical protein K8R03_02295 [Candidatus Kaiserbacteria bacterium]|nr:hypothetical protein [Candidatus Kaiserbacteria bacterium]